MKHIISEIQITPIKPKDGLVAFASFVFDNDFYFSSIGIFTKIGGGYRLTYPTRNNQNSSFHIFHPINKQIGEQIEKEIIEKYEEITKTTEDIFYE